MLGKNGDDGETILLTHPTCGGCHFAKKRLKKLGKWGDITERSIHGFEGQRIRRELDIEKTPSCVQKQPDGSYTECDVYDLVEINEDGEPIED